MRRSLKAMEKKRKHFRHLYLNTASPTDRLFLEGLVDGLDWCMGKVELTKDGVARKPQKRVKEEGEN